MTKFEERLSSFLNQERAENGSDTPDFILAEYLLGCLESFNRATVQRDKWWRFIPHWENNCKLEEKT